MAQPEENMMQLKRAREEDEDDNSCLSSRNLRAWPPAKPFGKNLPDHSTERGSLQQKRQYFGTWAEEDDVGTKRRLLNSGQSSVVAPTAHYNLQNYHGPVYQVLSHAMHDNDAEKFVHRMHYWRHYLLPRTPANRATTPPTPPNQAIPPPPPPPPAVNPREPRVPSAGHSPLSITTNVAEIGEAAQEFDGSNGKEEVKEEEKEEEFEEEKEDEDENTVGEADEDENTEDSEDEDSEDDEDEDANPENKKLCEDVEVFLLTELPAPVKDRHVEDRYLHTALENGLEQQTPRPRDPAPIIMPWNGVVDYTANHAIQTPTSKPMQSQDSWMQLLQVANQLMPDLTVFNQSAAHTYTTQQNSLDSLLVTPLFSTLTPPTYFNASTHNNCSIHPLVIPPTLVPFPNTTNWSLLTATADVSIQLPLEQDFPVTMGIQNFPLLDPLPITTFPVPANATPPSSVLPVDWLSTPTQDALSIFDLENSLFGRAV
ncbi:hypothetical protein HDU81_010855 [Chytriomyces hyalinus]|nr:hypothetical protein HDU81_010855 [Chytriomyces hyalinus]